jgi:hypothetical protein
MTQRQNEWEQFLGEYAVAHAEYQAAREAAARRSLTVERLTAAFLAEAQARDRLVSLRDRMYGKRPSAESESEAEPVAAATAQSV